MRGSIEIRSTDPDGSKMSVMLAGEVLDGIDEMLEMIHKVSLRTKLARTAVVKAKVRNTVGAPIVGELLAIEFELTEAGADDE